MGKNSKIAWTDHTFNPWWGCTKVSPGCDNCYAAGLAKRTGFDVWGDDKPRRFFGDKHWAESIAWNAEATAAGVRRRVFCGSMCDLFEGDDSGASELDYQRDALWHLIENTPNLDWLLLTKRPENVETMVPTEWTDPEGIKSRCKHFSQQSGNEVVPDRSLGWPANAWLGVTAENQEQADKRIPLLLKMPAPVRFLSCEPLLGPIDLARWLKPYADAIDIVGGINHGVNFNWVNLDTSALPPKPDWVIAGGESGRNARPMHPDWVRGLRDQCQAAGVAFFFKQWGEWHPEASSNWCMEKGKYRYGAVDGLTILRDGRVAVRNSKDDPAGRGIIVNQTAYDAVTRELRRERDACETIGYQWMQKIGRKKAGSLLDGRDWVEFPTA